MKRWPILLARLRFAMTMAIAAYILASTGALAHAGHHQVVHAETPATNQPQIGAPTIQSISVVQIGKPFDAGARGSELSLSSTHHQQGHAPCASGCCHSGSTCCCAAWLAPLAAFIPPQPGRLAVSLAVAGGAGVRPDALPEPPKSHF
jgi:hypothetical protein